ncbi:MarR family transcriptional regulator [Gryllotalpicola kribbensis]|uniref:MarR family transcriptional regulator n=1 Tax=Gryllotalpicola kribbensis TaxID=993084 RepID=A0ABP8ALY0_9MICO
MNESEVTALRRQVAAFQRRIRSEMSTGPVSVTDTLVLAAISRAGGVSTPVELAGALAMSSSNVAASLRLLESKQLLERNRHPDDGRRVLVSITEAGEELVRQHRRGGEAWLRRTIDAVLTDDEQALLRQAGELLDRITTHQ